MSVCLCVLSNGMFIDPLFSCTSVWAFMTNKSYWIGFEIKPANICLGKVCDLRTVFGEEFLVLKLIIWERFIGFGTNIHPCPPPTHHKLSDNMILPHSAQRKDSSYRMAEEVVLFSHGSTQPASRQPTWVERTKCKYLSNHWSDLTQILNWSLYDYTIFCKSFKWRWPPMEDDLRISSRIINLSLDDRQIFY